LKSITGCADELSYSDQFLQRRGLHDPYRAVLIVIALPILLFLFLLLLLIKVNLISLTILNNLAFLNILLDYTTS